MKQTTLENVKRYVPYGINGEYFVYDNKTNGIPIGCGTGGTKKKIQAICDKMNGQETASSNDSLDGCNMVLELLTGYIVNSEGGVVGNQFRLTFEGAEDFDQQDEKYLMIIRNHCRTILSNSPFKDDSRLKKYVSDLESYLFDHLIDEGLTSKAKQL